jgi:putative PIN family toxin of toxin-antitoxin system
VTRVVIDPGVLVSAFISPNKAAPALLVDAIFDGSIDMLVCPALIAELTDVLGREKFAKHSARGRAAAFIAASCDRATLTADPPMGSVMTADPDDDYLLALAQAHNADAVVSGDSHLLDAASSELLVLTPRELADRLGLAPVERARGA